MIFFKSILISSYISVPLLITLILVISSGAHAQSKSFFEGFYADFALGYRSVNTQTSSNLSLNGAIVPSTLSTSTPTNTVTAYTLGYNFTFAKSYILGIGANLSPASGQAQQVQVRALNQNISLPGIKPLYNYGIFITPGVDLGNGMAYLKAGTQTQVNNSNTSSNFYGYLLGLGYKQIVYQSVYLFGEADYASYSTQTATKAIATSGRMINASVTSTPQGSRFLIGVGYQF